jgi:hypothetical protein
MALRSAQRKSPELFADGIRAWIAGTETEDAEAAGLNVAEILILHAKSLTDNKWGA